MAVRELAAGSGNWCNGVVKAGFAGQADDIKFQSSHDLTKPEYVQAVMADASAKRFVIGHVGIECTTFSTAANPPYRDREFPEGLALILLDPIKGPRVQQANVMADNTAILLIHYADCNILGSAENPGNSILWDYWKKHGWMAILIAKGYVVYKVHYCYYKTKYQKATKIIANYPIIERPCCGSKAHEVVSKGKVLKGGEWQSRTKLANPYPKGLVRDWVKVAIKSLRSRHGC